MDWGYFLRLFPLLKICCNSRLAWNVLLWPKSASVSQVLRSYECAIMCAEKALSMKQCGGKWLTLKALGMVYSRPAVGEVELRKIPQVFVIPTLMSVGRTISMLSMRGLAYSAWPVFSLSIEALLGQAHAPASWSDWLKEEGRARPTWAEGKH